MPGYSSISFWPMTLCHRIPTSVERRRVTVLLMLMAMSACPCCTPMLETCPTGTPAMLTVSPLASPVTSLSCASMVWRLLKREMFPIFTASPTSRTRHTSANTTNLNAEDGKCRGASSRQAPEKLGDDAADVGRRGLVGLADDAVGLVGRRGARAVGARRSRRRRLWRRSVAAGVGEVPCSALNVASSDEQLNAEPAPASAC